MDILKVLKAATIFYKCAQEADANSANADLIGWANKLTDPNAVTEPDKTNIDTALLSTLRNEVQDMETQDRYPISRPESKAAAANLFEFGKVFRENLDNAATTESITPDTLNIDIQKLMNAWNQYKTSYLSEDFLNELELAKNEQPTEMQQDWSDRKDFWKEIREQIDVSLSELNALIQDQLTGNAEVPLESVTPP